MKIKIIILFLAFLFYAVTLNAQNQIRIDTISVNYFNGITKKKEIIDIYQIKNDSDEDYLTWVSLAPINNRTNTKLIRDYFIKTKGESRFYRERIVIIKKKEVERYLKMIIDKKYFYQLSDIFLIEK